MESPLLTKSESQADSSSNDEHIVMTAHDDVEETTHETEDVRAFEPCTEKLIWNLIELFVTLIQIFAAILVLNLTKDEQDPKVSLNPWILVYIGASIATLPILSWRFWHGCRSETEINTVIGRLEKLLGYFFLGWVLLFLWSVIYDPSCLDDTTQHFWLWVALLAFSSVRYVLPNFARARSWFSWPVKTLIEKLWDFMKLIYVVLCGFAFFIFGTLQCIESIICRCCCSRCIDSDY